jgi:hypothetical protein
LRLNLNRGFADFINDSITSAENDVKSTEDDVKSTEDDVKRAVKSTGKFRTC